MAATQVDAVEWFRSSAPWCRVTRAFTAAQLRPSTADVPEVAIAGASNSGKSALVNALLGVGMASSDADTAGSSSDAVATGLRDERLAVSSPRAGQTMAVTFYAPVALAARLQETSRAVDTSRAMYDEAIAGPRREAKDAATGGSHARGAMIVDLPGFGDASARGRAAIANASELVGRYLFSRTYMARLLYLVDATKGVTADDRRFLLSLHAASWPMQFVISKADAVPHDSLVRLLQEMYVDLLTPVRGRGVRGQARAQRSIPMRALPEVLVTSAHSGEGIEAVQAAICVAAGMFAKSTSASPVPRRLVSNERARLAPTVDEQLVATREQGAQARADESALDREALVASAAARNPSERADILLRRQRQRFGEQTQPRVGSSVMGLDSFA